MSFRGTAKPKRNLKTHQLPDNKCVGRCRADGFSVFKTLYTMRKKSKTTTDNIWGFVLTRDLFNVFAEPLMSASAQVSPAISNHGGVKDPAHALPRCWIVWGATKAFTHTVGVCTKIQNVRIWWQKQGEINLEKKFWQGNLIVLGTERKSFTSL